MPASDEPHGSLSWRIGGLAGEGIDTAGDLFGKAAMRAGWRVWTTRHFPSRIRGGLTTCTVRLASHPVASPSGEVDMLFALHQDGAEVVKQELRAGGWLLYDPDAVRLDPAEEGGDASAASRLPHTRLPIPCMAIAKEIGEKRARNSVALGASARLLGVPLDEVERVTVERFGGDPDADAWPEVARQNVEAVRRGADAAEQALRSLESGAGPSKAGTVSVTRPVLPMPPRAVGTGVAHGRDGAGGHPGRNGGVPRRTDDRLFLSGNEAFAYGALVAGCRFYAGYPITPATTIMEYLAAHLPAYGGVALQVEDELAAVNMVIGAGFAGARAMTATSGPGLSLMAEAMGLAGSTETPVVIVDCMRPGPSTGMPTKTGQEDLAFLVSGGHGEVPHVVLSVEDLDAAFRSALEAFDLAERYQCAVYVMLELALSMGKGDTPAFDLDAIAIDRGRRFRRSSETDDVEAYERYAETADGIPPRSLPGDVGGRHYANSTEHGPAGYTTEVPAVREAMVRRRNRKLDDIDARHVGVVFERSDTADAVDDVAEAAHEPRRERLGVIAFGATVPVVREAMAIAADRGLDVELAVLRRVWPLPREDLERFFERHDDVLVIEGNSTGQLLRLLRSEVRAAHEARSVLKYDGDPFRVDELLATILPRREVTA